jgi:ketosteroid isomerase-like protein
MGVTTGDWAVSMKGKPTPVVTGRYVTVWHKDAQGHWKGLIDIGESDAKPQQNEATRN